MNFSILLASQDKTSIKTLTGWPPWQEHLAEIIRWCRFQWQVALNQFPINQFGSVTRKRKCYIFLFFLSKEKQCHENKVIVGISLIPRFPCLTMRPINRHFHLFQNDPSDSRSLDLCDRLNEWRSSGTRHKKRLRICSKKSSSFEKNETSRGSGCASPQNSAGKAYRPQSLLTRR